MKIGDTVKLKPLFAFDQDKVDKKGVVVDIDGTFIVVKVSVADEHINPYTVRRPWDCEIDQ